MPIPQTIKIYINNHEVYLTNSENLLPAKQDNINIAHPTQDADILKIVEALEITTKPKTYYLIGKEIAPLKKLFESPYQQIEAGGGLVWNEQNELLLIFRRGMWDLPKGKIESDESIQEGAIREVIEETGAQNLQNNGLILLPPYGQEATLHTYFNRKKERILKCTYWYDMLCKDTSSITPQTEEDIEKVEWVKVNELPKYMSKTYGSIKDIVKIGVKQH